MTSVAESADRPVVVIAHLSGHYRGKIQRLNADRLSIGTKPKDEVLFSPRDLTPGLSKLPQDRPYAVLERRGDTYELEAAIEADIWVNGRRVERRVLESGDVLEIGEGGPVLRFRLYPPGSQAFKSVKEVFSDCAECIKRSRNPVDRAGLMIAGPPMELLTRTAPRIRAGTALLMVAVLALVAAVGWLGWRSQRLERELQAGTEDVRGLQQLLQTRESETVSTSEVERLRAELSAGVERIQALEARSEAPARVIAESARSVVLIQASWGFNDADGRALRVADNASGRVAESVTVEGEGPVIEFEYTGTAFVVSSDGLLLTNRHVAIPWDYGGSVESVTALGYTPVLRRFLGFLPGVREPFEVTLVRASDSMDVALLRCGAVATEVRPLPLGERPPSPGDEVIVLGYPTGINAVVARADPEAVRGILEQGPLDFWTMAERLSEAGLIEPLATLGIVGQVTTTSVVYDAETTHGGSGGPVLDLDGRVLAINAAILPEFGGSNMGVPAAEALGLLRAGR